MSDERCSWCDEPVDLDEEREGPESIEAVGADGKVSLRWRHFECDARAVLGSVGHLSGRCSCYGGTEEDPPAMTRRQAARAALELYRGRARTTRECE